MGSCESPPIKRRRIPWWVWPLLVIGIVFGSWAIWNLQMDAAIERELQAIRDAGYPATPEELDAWYEYPDGPNAANVIEQALAMLVPYDEADDELLPIGRMADRPDPNQPLSDKMRAAIDRYITANRPAMAKAREAVGVDGSRYPINLAAGVDVSLPAIGDLRTLAELSCLDAVVWADRGKAAQAVEAMAIAAAIARSLREEPLVISQLVRIAINGRLHAAVNDTVQRCDLDAVQLMDLDRMVGSAYQLGCTSLGLVGERTTIHDWMRRARTKGNVEIKLYAMTGLDKRDWLFCYGLLNQQLAAAQLPATDQLAAMAIAGKQAEHIPRSYFIARIIAPDLYRALEIEHVCLFGHNATLTALAMLRYRLVAGALPASLDDLVPNYLNKVPLDTFTGKPIEYERIGDESFILFTPGALGVTVPAKGDPGRIEFIRNLKRDFKFQYRVPADSPLRASDEEPE